MMLKKMDIFYKDCYLPCNLEPCFIKSQVRKRILINTAMQNYKVTLAVDCTTYFKEQIKKNKKRINSFTTNQKI